MYLSISTYAPTLVLSGSNSVCCAVLALYQCPCAPGSAMIQGEKVKMLGEHVVKKKKLDVLDSFTNIDPPNKRTVI